MRLPDDLRTYYDADYWEGRKVYDGDKLYAGPALQWGGFDAVRDALFDALGERPASLLDVCCGGGDFVRRCRAVGVEAFGVDGSGYAIAHAGPDLNGVLFEHDVLALNTAEWSFQIVTAFDALEHFYESDVGEVVARLSAIAKQYLVFLIGCSDSQQIRYSHQRGAVVPPAYEGMLVSGHVTVQPFGWWLRKIVESVIGKWTVAWGAMGAFQVSLIEDVRAHGPDGRPLAAWGPNRLVILERE